jgi:hypothetical protein
LLIPGERKLKSLLFSFKSDIASLSYESDRLRNSFDIRNRDSKTLRIYQKEQLKRYQEVLEKIQAL